MIGAKIHAEFLFADVTKKVEERAEACVTVGAQAGRDAAVQAGSARGLTDVEIVETHATGDGYASGLSGKWFYRFQSYGTLGKAIRPKRPGHGRSHAPGTGITPNLMWQKARLAGRRAMLARARQPL